MLLSFLIPEWLCGLSEWQPDTAQNVAIWLILIGILSSVCVCVCVCVCVQAHLAGSFA